MTTKKATALALLPRLDLKALPSLALWGADDLAYFQRMHAGQAFRLAASLEG